MPDKMSTKNRLHKAQLDNVTLSDVALNKAQQLRAAAEARVIPRLANEPSVHSKQEMLHELQVHQIELEMQNEELQRNHIALEKANKRYVALYEFAPVSYLTLTREGLVTEINISGASLLGEHRKKLLGSPFSRYICPEQADRWHLYLKHVLETGEAPHLELKLQLKDGAIAHVVIKAELNDTDEESVVLLTLIDITERKSDEINLKHANRAYAALSEVNKDMVRSNNEHEFLQVVCLDLINTCGYLMAWVGYVQHDAHKSIKVMAQAGNGESYLKAADITWANDEHGMGPSGMAIRSGVPQVCQNLTTEAQFLPWRDNAIKQGYLSSISVPLVDWIETSKVFGLLTAYSSEINAFTQSEIDLLVELASDVTYGLHTLQTRLAHNLAVEKNNLQLVQLKKGLEGTVQAICRMVEMRDPYTAGHQTRIALLASAIALKIGLSDDKITAIRFASELHDLGKIQVPAEILSKPGKLSAIEHTLINIHPQAGYDVLKDIDFPWPIAEMVLQHHERLDGSGYPQGLKGDEIMLEARIISVADVVEAMISHRPYRAGLGLEAALDEIITKRGSHFDPQVVDACVSLFREQAFSF